MGDVEAQNPYPKKEPLFPSKPKFGTTNPPALLTQPPRSLRHRPSPTNSPNANPKFNIPVRRPMHPQFFHSATAAAPPMSAMIPAHVPSNEIQTYPPRPTRHGGDSRPIPISKIQRMTASMKPKLGNFRKKNNSR